MASLAGRQAVRSGRSDAEKTGKDKGDEDKGGPSKHRKHPAAKRRTVKISKNATKMQTAFVITVIWSLARVYTDMNMSGETLGTAVMDEVEKLDHFARWAFLGTDPGMGSGSDRSRPMVMIATATRSVNGWTSVNETSLHKLLIPSLENTISPEEIGRFDFQMVIAFDVGDKFWETNSHRKDIIDSTFIDVNFLSIHKLKKHHIPMNEMLQAGYEHGAEYFVRVNDDSEFKTLNWTTKAIDKLESYDPPNVGVVGPTCKEGNIKILTHDFVHRTHLDIFGHYYPPEFDNWWLDDWISKVYGKHRTTKLHDWVIKHHTGKHGTRYAVDRSQEKLLDRTLKRGTKMIADFLERNITQDPYEHRVLGTRRVNQVHGSMFETHAKLFDQYSKQMVQDDDEAW